MRVVSPIIQSLLLLSRNSYQFVFSLSNKFLNVLCLFDTKESSIFKHSWPFIKVLRSLDQIWDDIVKATPESLELFEELDHIRDVMPGSSRCTDRVPRWPAYIVFFLRGNFCTNPYGGGFTPIFSRFPTEASVSR